MNIKDNWLQWRKRRAIKRKKHVAYFRLLLANKRLERCNARLMAKLIIQQIELEDIARDINSKRAKEIIAKYKRKIDRRKEQDLAEQN